MDAVAVIRQRVDAKLAGLASRFVADLFQACLAVGRKDEDQRAGGWNGGKPETLYGRKTQELVHALLSRREARRLAGLGPESSKHARKHTAYIQQLDAERIQLLVDEGIDPGTLGRRWRGQQQRLAALRVASRNPCYEIEMRDNSPWLPDKYYSNQQYYEGRRG